MKTSTRWVHVGVVLFGILLIISSAWAQTIPRVTTESKQPIAAAEPELSHGEATDSSQSQAGQTLEMTVPRLVKFASVARDQMGQPRSGVVGVSFAIYKDQEGGAPLWMETQNVKLDDSGHFNVLLGATKSEGLPLELFAASESRWLGVQVQLPGEVEQPRVLLVSVPYALKAADAESLGGKPASAYALATSGNADDLGTAGTGTPGGKGTQHPKASSTPTNFSITAGFIPMFTDSAGTLGNSVLIQSNGNIGVGTTPVMTLDVNGGVRGTGLATGGRGISPDAINTNQLFLNGSNAMAVLGSTNAAFAAGALFTKTSVYSGGVERLTIDGANGNVGIGTVTPAARLDVAGNQTITGNLAVSGVLSLPTSTSPALGVINVNGAPFLNTFGSFNTFLGANAGNFTMTGGSNTALGVGGLASNTTGSDNIAIGDDALLRNTTGNNNTASGAGALSANTTGGNNTASGAFALQSNTIGNSNTASGSQALQKNTGDDNSASGALALAANTTGGFNTASGAFALQSNTIGNGNTACGAQALQNNSTGNGNTASGEDALQSNTSGNANTAIGVNALLTNNGSDNTASGEGALQNNTTGADNTATGVDALLNNTTGGSNVAIGTQALLNNTTGSSNIAIGTGAGSSATTGDNNIYIGNSGVAAEGNTIRIGISGNQTSTFVAGIRSVTTGQNNAVAVLVDSNGQLGTVSSSRRFKYDIADMGQASNDLLRLRPVTFRYKQAQSDGSHPLQYGLIAEEVAEAFPELVAYGRDGQPETVKYHVLPALLLNELKRQETKLGAQEAKLEALAEENAQLRAALQQVSAEMQAIRVQVDGGAAGGHTRLAAASAPQRKVEAAKLDK